MIFLTKNIISCYFNLLSFFGTGSSGWMNCLNYVNLRAPGTLLNSSMISFPNLYGSPKVSTRSAVEMYPFIAESMFLKIS